ncbi:DUF2807 domain-containing protein [Mucilaginibacter sp. KACC 22773]|uniref:head GIN domain-containing protein n=1 Tax=Mucilaginibacter sp. KACC 22773 TaxID=3025671 RepID=UPI0023652F08|nr:head GIN domain-containing protein [Mucilaginibacter sp. KACC 22773]WDF77688.1 DUF2807 domain-containing protein [Mucilaginibacter sp. KACC 22773]
MENTLTSQQAYIERFIARKALVWLLLLLVFSNARAQAIKGNGQKQQKIYFVSNYSSIEIYTPVNVYLTNDTGAVAIEADSNIVRHIQVKAVKGTLVIKNDPGTWFNPKTFFKILIPAKKIRNIKNIGSADINTINATLTGPSVQIVNIGSGKIKVAIDCNDLKVKGRDAADFELSGKTQHAMFDLSGSGDVRAQELSTNTAELSLNGSCDAWVNCLVRLNVHIPLSSSSTVYYKGNPQIKKNGLGGSIEKLVL